MKKKNSQKIKELLIFNIIMKKKNYAKLITFFDKMQMLLEPLGLRGSSPKLISGYFFSSSLA